jgi:hypothetical protein
VGDGDDDQDHEESGPVASSTDAAGRDVEAKHAGVPLRRVGAVEGWSQVMLDR